MQDKRDQRVVEALRLVASITEPPELPEAERMWSQLQFRLRYHAQRPLDAYAFTGSTAIVGAYVMLFLMWDTHLPLLNERLLVILAFAAITALLLGVRVFRKLNS